MKRLLISTVIISAFSLLCGCVGSAETDSANSSLGHNSGTPTQTLTPIPTPFPLAPLPEVIIEEPITDIPLESTYFYFSYDDSASTAARDLSFAEIDANRRPPSSWGRAYEFLNAENFDHFNVELAEPFSVSIGLYHSTEGEIPLNNSDINELYALGINISGPTLNLSQRENIVLTLLVDVSGSMATPYSSRASAASTRLSVTQTGLHALKESLKPGDIVNLIAFNSNAQPLLTGWNFVADDAHFDNTIDRLSARYGTDIEKGIETAYRIAAETFDPEKSNRIILLTDAEANEGQTDSSIIADHLIVDGAVGIHFAGVGVGEGFNDEFLNELTDIGKSVYAAMITPADAKRIFNEGFMRFIDTAVTNVKFRIDYPKNFHQLRSAAEQISTDESKIDTINFAFNSEQFFLELFTKNTDVSSDPFILTITYDDDSGAQQTITIEKTIDEILNYGNDEIKSAIAVTTLADLIANRLRCETVKTSQLFAQDIPTWTFSTYQTAIEKLCN